MSDKSYSLLRSGFAEERPDEGLKAPCKRHASAPFAIITGCVVVALVVAVGILANDRKTCAGSNPSPLPLSPTNAIHFVHFSDAHLDLFFNATVSKLTECRYYPPLSKPAPYSAPFGRTGCDAPERLVDSQLRAMVNRSVSSNSQFVLFSGDSAAHNLPVGYDEEEGRERVMLCVDRVAQLLKTSFPNTPVFPAFGNNDGPKDYVTPNATSPWLEHVLQMWLPLFSWSQQVTFDPAALNETFLEGAYYQVSVVLHDNAQPLLLLVLNTNLFSANAPQTLDTSNRARLQLKWLREQLSSATQSGTPVYILGHIPPIVDPFRKEGDPFVALWVIDYEATYLGFLNEYSSTIAGQFFGHLHKDDFRVMHNASTCSISVPNTTPLLLAPAISPIFNTNPAFRVMTSDFQWKLVDYTQYFSSVVQANAYNTPKWLFDYTFSQRYGCSIGHTGECILSIGNAIVSDQSSTMWWLYRDSRQIHLVSDPGSRYAYHCFMLYPTLAQVSACATKYPVQFN